MSLVKKINRAYFFYNYCYGVVWNRFRRKHEWPGEQISGGFFPVICFILYIFLLAVILWRCGIPASRSAPVMFWLDILILLYGVYLGPKKNLQQYYFEQFRHRSVTSFQYRMGITCIVFSPVISILLSLSSPNPCCYCNSPSTTHRRSNFLTNF